MNAAVKRILALLAILALAGCGSAGQRSALEQAEGAALKPAAPALSPLPGAAAPAFSARYGSFTLEVDGASLLPGSRVAGFELREAPATEAELSAQGRDVFALEVRAQSALDLRALYFELDYDAEQYSPLAAAATGRLGASDKLLELALLSDRGAVQHGQVLKRTLSADTRGFSGSGAVARVLFARRPAPQTRISSAAPSGNGSQAPLMLEEEQLNLHWLYACAGDYNQDGQVAVADLTPIGLNFGALAEGGQFPPTSALAVVDGNQDGTISVQDLAAIGFNFRRKVTAFNVYQGTDVAQLPDANDAASELSPIGSLPFSAAGFNTASERIAFDFPLSLPPAEGEIYWVRPVDATAAPESEGTPSQYDGPSVVIVAPNVRIVDGNKSDPTYSSEFELLEHEGSFFLIRDHSASQDINEGDILVGFLYNPVNGQAEGGFLRRVTFVSDDLGMLTIETQDDVSMGEVFLKGGLTRSGLDFTGAAITDLRPGLEHTGCSGIGMALGRGASAAPGALRRSVSDDSLISFNLDGTVLYNTQSGENFFKVSLPQANFSFGPSFDIDADFDTFLGVPYDLNSFHAIAAGNLTANMELLVDGHWYEGFEKETKLYSLRKDYYFMVGPVPVWLAGKIDVYGGITGSAGVDCHARSGFNLDYTVRLGVKYHEDDGWSTVAELDDIFNPIPPELRVTGTADMEVYLRPEFALELYGSIGGGVKLKPYLKGHLDGNYDISNGPFCANVNLTGGFASEFFLYGKILGISLFDETWELFNADFDIYSTHIGCEEGPQAPAAHFQAGPLWFAVDNPGPYTVNFDATYYAPEPPAYPNPRGAYDPDGVDTGAPFGIVNYEWDLNGDGFCEYDGPNPIVSWDYDQKYVPYNATLWVTDEEGMVSRYDMNFQVEDPIG
ncbi:hypothetical protein IT575_07985 [bacterium]|nr:hypothetical protein [bacterium]